MMVSRAACIVLLGVFVALASSVANAAEAQKEFTERDFKQMNMQKLRLWMEDRGLTCPDCVEKADFVRFCTTNGKVPVLPSRQKKQVTGKFWEIWANTAKDICTRQAEKKAVSNGENICDAISVAVDSYFMQHGKRTANKLKKKPDALAKTSVGDTYFNAGRRLMGKLVKHCLKAENRATCASSSKVQDIIENNKVKGVDMGMWITNVGIENTNPMYETLKDRTIHDDEL